MKYSTRLKRLRAHVVANVPGTVRKTTIGPRALRGLYNVWLYLGLNPKNVSRFYTDFSDPDHTKWIDTRNKVAPRALDVILLFVEGLGFNPERALAGKVKEITGKSVKARLLTAIDMEIDSATADEE